jgi:hypothetical protein
MIIPARANDDDVELVPGDGVVVPHGGNGAPRFASAPMSRRSSSASPGRDAYVARAMEGIAKS